MQTGWFMKNLFLLSFVLLLTVNCDRKNSRINSVTQYYKALNNSDYNQVKSLITDSITIVEGNYIMPYSHETFHEHFKWDSIFQPTYKLIALSETNDHVVATVAVNSLRFEFLKNNPLTCRHKIFFKSGKLTKFENMDCIDADWTIWEKERDALVRWTSTHHPELDGFIHDLTMNGAINYLKAIALYRENKSALR